MAVLKHLITNKCTLAGQWSVVTLEFLTVSVSVIQKFDSVGQASLTPRPGSSMPRNNLAHTRYKIQGHFLPQPPPDAAGQHVKTVKTGSRGAFMSTL